MLWTTLVQKVRDYVRDNLDDEIVRSLQIGCKLAGKTPDEAILAVDIRNVQLLRDFFPLAFPRKLRTGRLVASQNIHGKWRVDPVFKMPAGYDPARDSDSGGYHG